MKTDWTKSRPQFEDTSDGLLVRAPAKINLCLLIGDKRPDGFHNLETIMAKINFYDELVFEHTEKKGIKLICTGPKWAPTGDDNLIIKAAKIFYKTIAKPGQIKITLKKNIPPASGLGGASSDAAATLLALNRLEKNPLHISKLHEICADLGSDIPFFLYGPLAFCSGRGEKIEKIDKNFSFFAHLILPNVSSSTKEVYGEFKVDLPRFCDLSDKIKAFLDQNRLDLIIDLCANMLDIPCFEINNILAQIRKKAEGFCVKPVCISGSGSSMFSAIAQADLPSAEITQRRIKQIPGCDCIMVSNNQW